MKKIYNVLVVLLISAVAFSCQDESKESEVGYLRLEISTNAFVYPQTKSIIDEYKPKQLAVQVINAAGIVVQETDDYTTWINRSLRLEPGIYTVKAFSNGFDGMDSGFDIPYYVGESKPIAVLSGKEISAEVICTLANVKVTVNFDNTVSKYFQSAKSIVASKFENVNPLEFVMGQDNKSAYFPVGDLTTTLSLTNQSGQTYTLPQEITGVKARNHYILNYKVADTGSIGGGENSGVTVIVDGDETTYTFIFNVSTEATTRLAVKAVNAWSNFAWITGEIEASDKELAPEHMTFEYKLNTSEEWISVPATMEGEQFKATLRNLTPNTGYDCRMVYRNNSDEYISEDVSFQTEIATTLVNGNMDDWYQSGKTWYPTSEAYFNANGSFWDSSNPGTTTGAGAIVNKNPTQGDSNTVHTAGGKSAKLASEYVSVFGITKFAAASLYTGKFSGLEGTKGAKINFGQSFKTRPTQLHGWFQYSTGPIQYVGDNTPASAGIVKGETPDLCSIYIALATEIYTLDNTNISSFWDFENDPRVIAYGELPASECVATNGEWKEFNIDLKYHDVEKKPEYLIIVCSSSKYGDYFTGSSQSVMYIDDMELIYGDTPSIK